MSTDLRRVATHPAENSSTDGSQNGVARVIIKEVEGRAKTVITIGDDAEGESSVSSVFTLCNSAIGAGVLSLPYAFGCAGEHLPSHSCSLLLSPSPHDSADLA